MDVDLSGTACPGELGAGTVARVGRVRPGSSTDRIMKTAPKTMYVSYRADAFVSKGDPPERLLAAVDDCWRRQHRVEN